MKAICQQDCTYGRRFCRAGDELEVPEGRKLPAHFRWAGSVAMPAGGDPLPEPKHERVLVLGDAPRLADDLARLGMAGDFSVMAINRSLFRYQRRVDYWASLHGSSFMESLWVDIWMRCPWNEGIRPHIITGREFAGLTHGFSCVHCDMPGGSAYLALKAVGEMGYKQIFVAGIDLMSPGYVHFAQPLRHLKLNLEKHGATVTAVSGALAGA